MCVTGLQNPPAGSLALLGSGHIHKSATYGVNHCRVRLSVTHQATAIRPSLLGFQAAVAEMAASLPVNPWVGSTWI